MRRKTNEEFKKGVYDLVGNKYTFLDPYVNARTKLKVKHNECGHIYEVNPHNFLHGTRCPVCSVGGRDSKTDAQFKREVYDLVDNEYTFLDEYVNDRTRLRVKHSKCNNIYKVTPSAFFKGERCPFCNNKAKRKTNERFKQDVFDLVGDEYVFLDSYVNAKTKIKVKHNTCGHTYKVMPTNFMQGKRCPFCYGTHRKTNEQFQQEIFDLVGNEYIFIDTYATNKTKIRVQHNKCGHVYKVRPNDFFQGKRCPFCSNYKGEIIINRILKSLKIKYEYQKTFDDLRDTQLLSYDFFIPNQSILIEYQGQQHYEPVDYFGGEDKFKNQQKHDKMKSDYAKAHNYNLIAIPYTEDTLPKIKKYLLTHGLFK